MGWAFLWGWVGLRGIGPALAGKLGGRRGFRAGALGEGLIASNARCGPIPLPPGDRESRGASPWVCFILGVVLDDSGVFGAGFCVSFQAVLGRADGEEEVMVRWPFFPPCSGDGRGIRKFFGKVL
jgi:hypothetical protein